MTERMPGLNDAYAMRTKDEVEALYQAWAQSYDAGFGEAQGYQLPNLVACAFVAAGGQGPVLDVGAGTGLVAEQLQRVGVSPIDALDLSADMLAVARDKALYRDLIVADVTQPMPHMSERYAGVVSAGTFTHGHVGPEGLPPLFSIAKRGCVFALTINAEHYATAGFETAFAALSATISDLRVVVTRIYDDRADRDHRDDLAHIVTFRLT